MVMTARQGPLEGEVGPERWARRCEQERRSACIRSNVREQDVRVYSSKTGPPVSSGWQGLKEVRVPIKLRNISTKDSTDVSG